MYKFKMAATSSISSLGQKYVLPSTNSSKPYQYLVEIIGLDHNYCRPWSEREKIPHARPAKDLFSPQTENENEPSKKAEDNKIIKISKEGELIDVDTVEEAPLHGPGAISMQYDVMKSKIVMSECEKYVSSASSKRTPDTWEELICRTGWTTQQNVLFDKILKIVSAYRLAWLTYQGSANEPILRRVAVDKATKRVRQILSRIEWDTKLTTWLHSSMMDGLSIPLLACYLDIVQTLRSKVPTLVDKMIAGGTTNRRVSAGTTDNLTALLKRPWDATVGLTSFHRPRKITGTPLLLIVPGGPTTSATGNSTKRSRFWHHHLSHFGKVIPVTMHLSNSARGVSVGQCLDHMIGAVQAKVLELKNHFPNRPVVLIGWATGALVSFQVSLKESVCAVICLGFPLLGVDGIRGGAGDSFLDSKIPTMFVFGSLSTSCSLPDIEEFRTKLLADTSLLVIGGADDQLRLTSAKKKKEGVTQSVVDRRIMDDIGEFLNQAVSNMNDDSHPRLDYFDFDDVENRRKKPKTEYRKRPAGDGTKSATAPKKPRGRTPKATNGEGNVAKKPKTVKTVKKTPMNKPAVLVPGTGQTGQAPGAPVRPTGNIPIAPLRGTHPTIPSGILQGVPLTSVSVPISAVGVPLTGVPVSRVSIPGVRLSGVNIPVSGVNVPVSAVIKQGSLGGRSFVFPGAVSRSPNLGVTTSGITTMGTSGNTHHLKIVVNPTDGGIQLTGPSKSGLSSASQATLQYKTAIVTAPLPNKTYAPVKATTANSTSQTSTISTTTHSTLVTSLPITSAVMTTSALTSSTTSSTTVGVSQAASTTSSKPIVVSRTVVTVPKSAMISGQAQFVVHQGQLSAVGKQASMRPFPPGNPPTQHKVAPQGTRVNTSSSAKPQTTVSSTASKQTTVRVSHAGSPQSSTNLARKSPSTQSMARTIQVGVKRTVTYNPSTASKNVTVVSRSLPSEALTTHVSNVSHLNLERLKAKLKTIQNLTGLQTGGQIGAVQMKTSQTLTTPASTSVQNIKSRNIGQSSTQTIEGTRAQTTSKLITQAGSQSFAQSSSSISVQGNSKSSAQAVTMPTAQTTTKSNTQTVALATASTTPKSSSQTVQSSTQASLSSARPTLAVTEKSTAQSSPKPSTQLVQTTAPTAGKPVEQSTKQSTPQVTGKPSAMSIGKSNPQSTTKPTTHFIQVPASAKSSALNTAKTSAQTSSAHNTQSTAQVSTQSTPSSSTTARATSTVSRATSLTSQATSTTTTTTISQKEEPIGERASESADVHVDQSDSSFTSGSKSDEEKLAEKFNDIVKEVVGGKQRTTRQSVRRLVAATRLAEEQHKHGEIGEGSKDQNKK